MIGRTVGLKSTNWHKSYVNRYVGYLQLWRVGEKWPITGRDKETMLLTFVLYFDWQRVSLEIATAHANR